MKSIKLRKMLCMLVIMTLVLSNSVTTFAWSGTENGTGTHPLIVSNAVNILENDLTPSDNARIGSNLGIIKNYINDLRLGSVYPDYDPNKYKLYQDHFWDPDTGNNFTKDKAWYIGPAIDETAESQIRRYTAEAKSEWAKGNHQRATFLLGCALHFLGDINNPYHATNQTALDGPGHVKFESYVEGKCDSYSISTMGVSTSDSIYQSTLTDTNYSRFSTNFSYTWAKKAKSIYYSHASWNHTWAEWEVGATNSMHNSQKSTALFIYRFLHEVSGTLGSDNITNELILTLKTANDTYSGTDSHVYFGYELLNGQRFEKELDNAGNDFEQGNTDSYRVGVNNLDVTQIRKFWLRTSKLTVFSDDWKCEFLKVSANNNIIFDRTINKWFGDYETYYMNK